MEKSSQNTFIKIYYTFVTILSPILMMYSVGIATMTFLDLAMVFCFLGMFLKKKVVIHVTRIDGVLLLFIFSIIFNLIGVSVYRNIDIIDVGFRAIRLITYIFWAVIGAKEYFDVELAFKMWRGVCVFATAYLLFQYTFLILFNVSIPGYIPFLKVQREELVSFTESLSYSSYARPRSIFAEPSQYGIYLTGYLMATFFKKNSKLSWTVLLLYLGMFLSASTTAVVGVFLSLFFYFKKSFLGIKTNSQKVFLIILAVIVASIILGFNWDMLVPLVEKIIVRLPQSFENRLSGWEVIVGNIENEGLLAKFMGLGMDANLINSWDWTSSVLKIIVYFGYIGFSVFVLGVIYMCLQSSKNTRMYMLILVLLGFFTELLVSNWLVLFVPVIYMNEEETMQRDDR